MRIEAAGLDLRVYSWVLSHDRLDIVAMASDLGINEVDVIRVVHHLTDQYLLSAPASAPDQVRVVPPDIAVARRSAPLEASIRERQRELEQIRRDFDRFTEIYQPSAGSTGILMEVVHDHEVVRGMLTRASAECSSEVLSCQPGDGVRSPATLRESLARDRALLERGIKMRTLHQHTARFHGPTQAYVATTRALGAEYRTAHELFGRLIVFDDTIAFLPTVNDTWGAVVIREPNAVAYLSQLFEQTWTHATVFEDAAAGGLEDVAREIDQTLLRLLAAGLKDEAIARRLGMSLRTVRRRIADILDRLGAESRFQAAVIATRRGLLDADRST
ncbi:MULTISPECIES: LuxR C-terminal-related transcriptional regulator [Streptomyces]|uniref:Response regulator transcription factor n=1 Tax=Streptomyces heilongjiangensis TaxID=945052 RepID=A0ABW1B1H7_9ACTN|nr:MULTISPECIES: LuxR C-terminal-related transcriptional regulator [Streptomyces]MDC2945613.1 LuxR C-terminal-related transcriptional regulator [Streptomyces heilongjiangensis]